jgi:hypothetical protein
MSLSTLHVDVLLHVVKFLSPADGFNLVISGVLSELQVTSQITKLSER